MNKLLKIKGSPPEDLTHWLIHTTSLTNKLKAYSGEAELEVLRQNWVQTDWWDRFTLGLEFGTVIHRDILMYSQKLPCWFARTIIPKNTYQANLVFFDRLKQESLGTIIFNEPSIERKTLLNYAIDKKCIEYHWLPECLQIIEEPLWLRLSLFTFLEVSSFYLVEIMLPGLMSLKCKPISN